MITFVSALYPGLYPGLGEARVCALAQAMRQIGLPLVLYADPACEAGLRRTHGDGTLVLRLLDATQLEAGLWQHEVLQKRWPEAPMARLARSTRLRSLGLLHDESIHNPCGSAFFVWLDPWLLNELHPAYLGLAPRMAALLERFLLLRAPGADAPLTALFGGRHGTLAAANHSYWERYAQLIDAGQCPSAEALLATVQAQRPGQVQWFELQSNGLVGHFFESLRQGPLRLERDWLAGGPRHG